MNDKLNIGCGKLIRKGYTNLDWIKTDGVDVVHNLEKFPYPFKDEQFSEIIAKDVVEHLKPTTDVMKELHRILKKGGVLKITVPHFSSYSVWLDPTHYRAFSYDTFTYFCADRSANFYKLEGHYHTYNWKFSNIKRRILFPKGLQFWNYLIDPLANAFPYIWEHTGLRNLFPAENIYVELVK